MVLVADCSYLVYTCNARWWLKLTGDTHCTPKSMTFHNKKNTLVPQTSLSLPFVRIWAAQWEKVFYWIQKTLQGTSSEHKNDQCDMPQAVAPAGPTTTFFLHLKHCHCKWIANTGILAKVQWVLQGRAWPAVTGREPRSPLRRPRGYLYFFPSPLFTSFSFTPVEHHPKFPLLRWHKLDPGFPAMSSNCPGSCKEDIDAWCFSRFQKKMLNMSCLAVNQLMSSCLFIKCP